MRKPILIVINSDITWEEVAEKLAGVTK